MELTGHQHAEMTAGGLCLAPAIFRQFPAYRRWTVTEVGVTASCSCAMAGESPSTKITTRDALPVSSS